jgi:hypothetical protein
MATKLKDMPKKGTIIRNLLDRADNMSLAVKVLESGEHKIYWEVDTTIHQRASKELLELMPKEELYDFIDNICHTQSKRFAANTFKFETHMPSRRNTKTK